MDELFGKIGQTSVEELIFLSGATSVEEIERVRDDSYVDPLDEEDGREADPKKKAIAKPPPHKPIIMVNATFHYPTKVYLEKMSCRHIDSEDGLRECARRAARRYAAFQADSAKSAGILDTAQISGEHAQRRGPGRPPNADRAA